MREVIFKDACRFYVYYYAIYAFWNSSHPCRLRFLFKRTFCNPFHLDAYTLSLAVLQTGEASVAGPHVGNNIDVAPGGSST